MKRDIIIQDTITQMNRSKIIKEIVEDKQLDKIIQQHQFIRGTHLDIDFLD